MQLLYKHYFKRIIDVLFAVLGGIFLLPVFFVVLMLVFFQNKGNPFFCQKRLGLHASEFTIYKFKSMSEKKDSSGTLLPSEERLTSFGRFLRSSSLDEAPQLLNILRGEMSFIGPRPLLVEYLPLYSQDQMRRHAVLPGLSGWAQVNGRNSISWAEKFVLDLWYVDHLNFFLDIKILILTIKKVFVREGINNAGGGIVSKFNGFN
ncbi:sugar transferase [Bacteroidales bacterium]|nr:sugar transferase [Bacteroidales bacterium]